MYWLYERLKKRQNVNFFQSVTCPYTNTLATLQNLFLYFVIFSISLSAINIFPLHLISYVIVYGAKTQVFKKKEAKKNKQHSFVNDYTYRGVSIGILDFLYKTQIFPL